MRCSSGFILWKLKIALNFLLAPSKRMVMLGLLWHLLQAPSGLLLILSGCSGTLHVLKTKNKQKNPLLWKVRLQLKFCVSCCSCSVVQPLQLDSLQDFLSLEKWDTEGVFPLCFSEHIEVPVDLRLAVFQCLKQEVLAKMEPQGCSWSRDQPLLPPSSAGCCPWLLCWV